MDILVIGGGGREHAIIKMLKASPSVGRLYAAPGNGGIASEAECTGIAATDMEGIKRFVKETRVDFAAVIPDDPLALGAITLVGIGRQAFPCLNRLFPALLVQHSPVCFNNKNSSAARGLPNYFIYVPPKGLNHF